MNDAVSEAEAASGPRDAGAALAVEKAFGVHVQNAPPLAWLAALSALAAMTVNQLLLPALNDASRREMLRDLSRWGAFAGNLAAISGVIAFSFGLLAFVRYNTVVHLRKRLILAGFSGIFLATIALAIVFERQRTTTQLVLFAIAAAHVLGALLCTSAFAAATTRFARTLALLGAAMAGLAMLTQFLQVVSQLQLALWQVQAQQAVSSLGEVCYLLLLVGLAKFMLPGRADVRARIGRLLALFVLPAVLGAAYLAERVLDDDFALLLYHAQRVTLFIDSWPRLYAVPVALVVAASVAAVVGGDANRRQAAAGALLLIGAGFTPHAPGRLLTSALALLLIARALMGSAERDPGT